MEQSIYKIHTDGGSRGNPGPAAAGYVIEGVTTGKKEYGEYLGETTNNEAEYRAVILALKKLKSLIGVEKSSEATVNLFLDSELVCKQLSGEYKLKEPDMQGFFIEIWNLRLDFKKITFTHIPREKNSQADRLVNITLDKEEDRLPL
jgi:ribonuclease HI